MKTRLFSFVLLFLILSSCASDTDTMTDISEHIREIPSANYIAHITASFPGREVKFSLNYVYSKDGDDRASVISPEELTGISMTHSEKSSHIEFDGARLEFGSLDESGLSPFSALPKLITVWTNGNFEECTSTRIYNRDAYMLISRISDGGTDEEYRSWFSKDNLTPLYAEIFSDGERVIQCEFERAESN